jgi:NTE family protein
MIGKNRASTKEKTGFFLHKKAPVGLALSGGAAHGLAHIGVLQCLSEFDFEPDLICGASAGAMVGLLYASGLPPMQILEVAKRIRWRDLISFKPGSHGLFSTDKVPSLLQKITGNPDWQDLSLPFYPISFDYSTGRTISPRQLSPVEAVHASMSIPVLFKPVAYNESALGDGGMTEIVPSKFCHKMGAGKIIGVNVIAGGMKPFKHVDRMTTLMGQLKQIMLGHAFRPFEELEDVYIVPDVNRYTVANIKPVQWYFDQGYAETQKHINEVLALRS